MKSFDKVQDKKILILSSAYSPFVGGAEIAVKEITDRINDYKFDMITARMDRKLPKFEKIGNINVYRIGFGMKVLDKYIYTFFGFFKALKLHLRNRYRIIWPIMAAYSSFAVLFKIFFLRPKILLTLQEGDPIEYIMGLKRFRIFWPIFKFYFHFVDYAQTISVFLAKWAEKMGVQKEKIKVVPNGVDLQKFKVQSSKFKVGELKKELEIKDDEKVIITVSRLVKKNAVGDIIEALKYLPENIKLLILGTGSDFEKLKSLSQEIHVDKRVIFLGQIGHEEMSEYLKISSVFVRPSLSEGLGNVFLEAMAVGIPVIATPVGGITDFLKDGETGLFCEIRNPQSIAEKVKMLLENKEFVQEITANAKEMVIKNYDWNLIAEKMKNIFNKLCL